jgi:hypothetical protein
LGPPVHARIVSGNSFVISKGWMTASLAVASRRFRRIQICPKDLSPRLAAQSSVRAAGIDAVFERKEAEIEFPATPV